MKRLVLLSVSLSCVATLAFAQIALPPGASRRRRRILGTRR